MHVLFVPRLYFRFKQGFLVGLYAGNVGSLVVRGNS